MQGRPVIVQGNGLPCRSYLYAADLTVWLLHMLVRAQPGKPYNVGSDETVSIRDLAERTARLLGTGEFTVLGAADAGWNPGRYVPKTDLVTRELGLYRTVSLDEAIRRTALWHGWKK
jgi:nucleoside-diphosphate-sugar epimerase